MLCVEQDHISDSTELVLAARQIERIGCGSQCRALCLKRGGVELQRPQRVGDVLECRQHGALVLRKRHVVTGLGGSLRMQELEAVEYRLRAAGGGAQDDRAWREQCSGGQSGAAIIASQVELR